MGNDTNVNFTVFDVIDLYMMLNVVVYIFVMMNHCYNELFSCLMFKPCMELLEMDLGGGSTVRGRVRTLKTSLRVGQTGPLVHLPLPRVGLGGDVFR